MTLILPKNFPGCLNHVFDYNATHNALVLDYGSVQNHHKSANTRARPFTGFNFNIHFQVSTVPVLTAGFLNMRTTML